MGEEVCCILWKTVKKNPAKQDSPPAAGRVSDILPFRRSAILAERLLSYGNEVSNTMRKPLYIPAQRFICFLFYFAYLLQPS